MPSSPPSDVTVHLFAAARAAAGSPTLSVPSGQLSEVLGNLVAEAPALGAVLPQCSFLLDGMSVRASEGTTVVPAGSRLDVLPPFAGG